MKVFWRLKHLVFRCAFSVPCLTIIIVIARRPRNKIEIILLTYFDISERDNFPSLFLSNKSSYERKKCQRNVQGVVLHWLL